MGETEKRTGKLDEATLHRLQEEIEKIQFGSVTVVIHEGKIVQLDTNQKIRLP